MDLRRISLPHTHGDKLKVVSIEEVKQLARVTDDGENALIGTYIEVAYDYLSGPEGWLGGCCLLSEDWELYSTPLHSRSFGRHFELPLRPVRTITSLDVLAGETYGLVAPTIYQFMPTSSFGYVRLAGTRPWPYTGSYNPSAYRIRFTAGFGTTGGSIPSPIRMAIKMLAATWYRDREMVGNADMQTHRGLLSLAGRYRIGPDHS